MAHRYACLLLLAIAGPVAGQTPAEIVERAVKAHGGSAVSKMKFVSHSAKGRFNFGGIDVPATRAGKWALPDRVVWDLEMNREGTKLRTRIGVVGLAGWQQVNANPAIDLSPTAYDTMVEESWMFWLSSILPLNGKGLKFAPAEPAVVNNDAALGVLVTRDGKPDVTLWFSKATGLLTKARFKGSDGGRATSKEFVFADHKEFDGVKLPTKLTDYANGVRMGEWQITEWKFADKLNADDFNRPK
ncbi:MAG: hypothetical protein K1X57_15245 [Gemmataceae bacterium]|nr:hypothetical protein [Gemmataceae bacterium]